LQKFIFVEHFICIMNFLSLEICSGSYLSALAALKAGASRVELCKVLRSGGVTPSPGLIQMASALKIKVNVLIRPREGDFLYSGPEAEEILRDIDFCGRTGVHGIVVGALKHNATVDTELCREFIKVARKHSLSTTFHRAIDRTADILSSLDAVISLGFDRVLTSGGCPTAYEGIETITHMESLTRSHSGGRHLIVMPGCGITPENICEIAERTGVSEIHMSASRTYHSEMTVSGGIADSDDPTVIHSDEAIIKKAIEALHVSR